MFMHTWRRCSISFLRVIRTTCYTLTLVHTRGKRRRSRSKRLWLKKTPRDTHLHINRGSPYQKQRGLSSQPTSSGTGRGERGFRKRAGGGSENMLHGRKGRAKSFITVITTWAHLLFHSEGGEIQLPHRGVYLKLVLFLSSHEHTRTL